MREKVKARRPPEWGLSSSEASRSNKELDVSKMRAGESVIRTMGAVGYAVKGSMSMRDCHTRMVNG